LNKFGYLMPKFDLSNPAKRDALPARTCDYAHHLGSKRYVLLRKGARGSKWAARVPDRADAVIGDAEAMTFAQAAEIMMSDAPKPDALRTIGDAVTDYVDAAAKTKSKASMGNIRAHQKMIATIAAETVAGCSESRLNCWESDLLTDKRGPVGANKIIGTLKAALEIDGIDGPWQRLRKFKEPQRTADNRAPVFTPNQVKLVLDAAETDPEVHNLLMALWLT
jgi:hypothetical protein